MLSHVTYEELGKALLSQHPPKVIDVREPEEFSQGHLDGAELVPLGSLASYIRQKFPNKLQPVVLYCDMGIRSHHAARLLRAMGYKNVKEIMGGWNALVAKGKANS